MTDTGNATAGHYLTGALPALAAALWTPTVLLVPYLAMLVRDGGWFGLGVLILGQLLLTVTAIILAHTVFENWPALVLAYGSIIIAASLITIGFIGGLLTNPASPGEIVKLTCTQTNTNLHCDPPQN